MLLISCPWCGDRDESEFSYGGDARRHMPALDSTAKQDVWHAYVHLRENAKGLHIEYWYHGFGCGRWLMIERDTVNHQIKSVRDASLPRREES